MVKNTIYKDRYLIDTNLSDKRVASNAPARSAGAPSAAKLNPEFQGKLAEAEELGISIQGSPDAGLILGQWYPTKEQKGVFVSVLEASAISSEVLNSNKDYVKKLGPVEKKALNYLIAFDLKKYDLNFSVGTEHPRVGWSARVRQADRDLSIPGPDGFDTRFPIANTGLIPPHVAKSVVATFTGGFKRSHGAFKWGPLAKINNASHYGFMENGVLISKTRSSRNI